MTVVSPHPMLSNNKSSNILRKEGAVFMTVAVAGLPGILFVDIHSCSMSARGIHKLNALL